MSKGIFIPDITVEMLRKAPLEAVETLLVVGEMHDVDMPKWIPCSERLPLAEYGESDTVLTTCGYRDVEGTSIRWIRALYFNGGVWCYPTGETYEQKVIAWMPLPEPYQERGEQE